MAKIQATGIPEPQPDFLIQLARDLRAALSYIAFYSSDSPFVIQAVQKLLKDLQRLFQASDTLLFHLQQGKLYINDKYFPNSGDLLKHLEEKEIPGVQMAQGLTQPELTACLRRLTLPYAEAETENADEPSRVYFLSKDDQVELPAPVFETTPPEGVFVPAEAASNEGLPLPNSSDPPTAHEGENQSKTHEALLSFVAEAWQYSQLQKRNLGASAEMSDLAQSFSKLFGRLLDRMESVTPDFKNIYQWFKSPPGQLMENETVTAMFPLLEVAMKNDWSAVLFDPATEGLVNDCLTYWGANGRHDLVEKTVCCLSDALGGGLLERPLALNHLMDARPWVRNPELLERVLDRLNSLMAHETEPSLYQSALLLAWDLMDAAVDAGRDRAALTLLATLHFHCDDDNEGFPDRSRIARHWLYERSTPERIRRFSRLAFEAGQLSHFPQLGEMAAPLLMEDFLMAPSAEKAAYLPLFAEIKEPLRSSLGLWLADVHAEEELHRVVPVLRICGLDPALSLQLSAWVSRGSEELKVSLISLIEEMKDPAGGPALRLALFDDSEEIAAMAARVMGKIGFTPGLPVLLRAVKIRAQRNSRQEAFLASVCGALGDLGNAEARPFLEEIARKKSILRGHNYPLELRLEAVRALSRINQPEVWTFLESLMDEKNPPLQEELDRIIHEKVQTLS
ncbi:MAG TPA: HEAT repeat domain-containing protein [bacterium]|nr:HEAT repeat domain-containing protein [bacterium]